MIEITERIHISVLPREVVESLAIDSSQAEAPCLLLDCTVGAAGHSYSLLASEPRFVLFGLDQDYQAIDYATRKLNDFAGRFFLACGNFRKLSQAVNFFSQQGQEVFLRNGGKFSRILVDLGISSDQLDSAERGFSFSRSGPLDMRMDQTQQKLASHVVNEYSVGDLRRVLSRGGVGAESGRLAQQLVNNRPYESTEQLAAVCKSLARPNRGQKKSHNPATVVFQAIRIEVNDELNALEEFLKQIPDYLAPGGRLAIISFHSLEDKLVAQYMRRWSRTDQSMRRLPMTSLPEPFGKLLTKQAITPRESETSQNPRSRSARMRVFERSLSPLDHQ